MSIKMKLMLSLHMGEAWRLVAVDGFSNSTFMPALKGLLSTHLAEKHRSDGGGVHEGVALARLGCVCVEPDDGPQLAIIIVR